METTQTGGCLEMRCRRKIGSTALSLVAVLLLGGIATASASAATFEAKPSFPVKFTATGGAGLLQTAKGRTVSCKESTGSGEVASATAVSGVAVTFKGCFAEGLAVLKCTGTGNVAGSGEITTKPIKGEPVDIDKAHTKAGILLSPEGELFAEFKCEFSTLVVETVKVKGSVIGKVKDTDVNKFTKELHLELIEVKGTPMPNQVEEAGEKHVLLTKGEGTEPFEFEESGIQESVPGTTTTTALEGKEIKLVP
jgi:hypothetical protein